MLAHKVVLLDDAKEDLREIRRLAFEASGQRHTADAYLERIRKHLQALEHTAEAQPWFYFADGTRSDYRFMPVERYVAFFTVDERTVRIKRILPQRSNREAWLKRTSGHWED